jgi:putative lumazine-binding protein
MEDRMTDEKASFAAYEEIAEAIQVYIDSARAGDAARMRGAFLPGAMIRGSYAAKATDWSVDDFCGVIGKGGPAAGLVARIAGIELSGTAAMARLEAENWRGTRYTDFFVLLKRDDGWRIASKVFFAHARA